MARPLIGLTCKLAAEDGDTYVKLDRLYPAALKKAGGEPLMLPFVASAEEARAWLDRVDALMLTGGPDIDPARWGEPKQPESQLLHPDKEKSDFLYIEQALDRAMPVLGICLGSQELNVAFGGSLHQHIGDEHRGGKRHEVEVAASRLRDILGTARPTVNSYHHQAMNRVGDGLKVLARAPDGVVEAMESERHPWVLAVQWHPERIADQPEQMRLFGAFVEQARRDRP